MSAIGNFFGMLMQAFGFARERSAAKNSAEIKANEKAKTDQQIKDDAAKNIAAGNIDQIRKDISG